MYTGPKSYTGLGSVHGQGCWGGRAESGSDARGGRVPHLLQVGGEAPQQPEPKPPRAGSGLPHPRLGVALASPGSAFASTSTPPASRSSLLLPGSSPENSTPPCRPL